MLSLNPNLNLIRLPGVHWGVHGNLSTNHIKYNCPNTFADQTPS